VRIASLISSLRHIASVTKARTLCVCLFVFLPKLAFCLVPDATNIDFDKLKLGFTRTLSLTFENTGTVNDTIINYDISPQSAVPDEFFFQTTDPTPIIVPAGKSFIFKVSFSPAATGFRTALLNVYTKTEKITVSLIGQGVTIEPRIKATPFTIDFGTRLPGDDLDTLIEVAASGPDDANIINFQVSNDNGISGIFDPFPDDATLTFPHLLRVGEKIVFHAVFHPQLPEGDYTGRIEFQGSVLGDIICEFRGSVALPNVQIYPGVLDFGVLPQGGSADSVVWIVNTKTIAANIETFTSPLFPFTVSNPPQVPYKLAGGDTLELKVHVIATNVGPALSNIEVVEKSPDVSANNRSSLVQVNVIPKVLESFPPAPLDIACGVDSSYTVSYTMKDTGIFSINVDDLVFDTLSLSVIGTPVPATLSPGDSKTVLFKYTPDQTLHKDTLLIFGVKAYGRIFTTDTLWVHVHSVTSPVALASYRTGDRSGSLVVKLDPGVTVYPLSTLRIVLSITAQYGGADLDVNAVKANFPGSSVTINPLGGGKYELLITSPTNITSLLDSILNVGMNYYVTKDTSYSVTIEAFSPENDGCLAFAPATITTKIPNNCGDDLFRGGLKYHIVFSEAGLQPNPSAGNPVDLSFSLNVDAMMKWEVFDLTGASLLNTDYKSYTASNHNIQLDISNLLSGTYILQLSAYEPLGSIESKNIKFTVRR